MSKELVKVENKCCDKCRYFYPSEESIAEGNGTEWIECALMYVESQTYLNTKTFYCSFFKGGSLDEQVSSKTQSKR